MEIGVYIAVVGSAILLLALGIHLFLRRTPWGKERLEPRFRALAIIASSGATVLGVIDTLDGRFVWQGIAHFALAIGWLLLWRLNPRASTTPPEGS